MDINQLNCFISVAQTLNFSEAARRNYVSQSTVSRYVSDLEKEFGVQLFTRSHRDVIMTHEGKILLPYAIDIVNSVQKAKTVIKEMRDGGTGKITVGCDITSMSFPSRCISEFNAKYPGISIELKRIDAADRSQAITGGEFDFCFMPRDMVPDSSAIETVVTHSEPLAVIGSRHSKLGKGSKISITDLADEKLILLSEACAPILFMEIMDLLHTFHISPNAESPYNDLVSMYVAVSSGMGVTILPKSLADFASDSQTKTYMLEDADTGVVYVAAWSKAISNPVAKLFIEVIQGFADGEDSDYGL